MTGATSKPAVRPLRLIAGGVLAALIIGGGLALLAFSAAVSLASWVRSQPEPATILFGESMPPTLQNFDVVYLAPVGKLQRGDIVSYRLQDSRIMHRIVGLPGETVEIVDGDVRIGGSTGASRTLAEPYVKNPADSSWDHPQTTLGPGQYLTLGDNRAHHSGRTVHVVDEGDIAGVAYRVVFPPWRARELTPPSAP